jgi:ribosomal protein L37AE/L43A
MPLSDGYTDHKCTTCNEDELVYNTLINDWHCQACGNWEDGE